MDPTTSEYTPSPEMMQIALDLKKYYYSILDYVDLNCVLFCYKSGDKPEKSKHYLMSGINSGWVKSILYQMDNTKLYCLWVWEEIWHLYTQEQKEWIVFDSLYSIHQACDGRMRIPDIAEHGLILTAMMDYGVGPYWRHATELPKLLNDDLLHFKNNEKDPLNDII